MFTWLLLYNIYINVNNNKTCLMKKFILLIAVIAMVSCTTKKRDAAAETKENYTVGLKCFITSDGKEYSGFRNGVFMNVPRGTFVVASVFQIGTDSVQIMYSSKEYGNGEYSWITSLSNYNTYETHRIRARVGEAKNSSTVNPNPVIPMDSVSK